MERYLQKLGLEPKEIQVYLTCLKNENNTPATLTRQTGLKRSTVYFYLEKLIQKGLIGSRVQKKRRTYIVISPSAAKELFFEQKENQLSEQKRIFEKLLPRITEASKEKGSGTKVSFLEGKSGVQFIIKKILSEKKDLYWYGSNDVAISLLGEENLYRRLTLERLKQRTTSYAITDKRILRTKRFSEELGNFRMFRFLEKDLVVPAMLIIFGDNVCITSHINQDIKIVLIEDALMSKILLSMFWNLWERIPANEKE